MHNSVPFNHWGNGVVGVCKNGEIGKSGLEAFWGFCLFGVIEECLWGHWGLTVVGWYPKILYEFRKKLYRTRKLQLWQSVEFLVVYIKQNNYSLFWYLARSTFLLEIYLYCTWLGNLSLPWGNGEMGKSGLNGEIGHWTKCPGIFY